jgi:AcrR family transcriptional regulator
MSSTVAYRAGGRQKRSVLTRARIVTAVRGLLAEGSFHGSTVDEVAERAGIARATLYQHFGSRLDLLEAACDSFSANPSLAAVEDSVVLPDPAEALVETIWNFTGFWAAEDEVLAQVYGVAAIDAAARALVERQRAGRRASVERLVTNLRMAEALKPKVTDKRAVALLMMLTSYETYRELCLAGLSERKVEKALRQTAREMLLA